MERIESQEHFTSSDQSLAYENIQSEKDKQLVVNTDFTKLLLTGICLKLGGCSVTWTWGLAAGFWECFMGIVTVGIGYIMLGLCVAEMVSVMTFDGGYYGYARVIMGPLGGYLIGCSGLLEITFAFSGALLKVGKMFQIYYDISDDYQKYIWIILYAVTFLFHSICRGKLFWNVITVIAVLEILLMLFYLFSSMPHLNFDKYALEYPKDHSGWDGHNLDLLFGDFQLGSVFFLTSDYLTLASSETKDANWSVPRALVSLVCIMFVLSIWLLFTVPSQPPGELALLSPTAYFPLAFGFQNRLGISYKDALVIGALPLIPTTLILHYFAVKQVIAMASSGLLPSFLTFSLKIPTWQPTWEKLQNITMDDMYIVTHVLLCFAAFGCNYFVFAVVKNVGSGTSRIMLIACSIVYLAMFYCYSVFKSRYAHMERNFTNPIGYIAPIIGSLIFLFILIILLSFNLEFKACPIFYVVFMGIMLCYYYFYAEAQQKFSPCEQQVFFRAYIINSKLYSLLFSMTLISFLVTL
jgi:ethanolamine permease